MEKKSRFMALYLLLRFINSIFSLFGLVMLLYGLYCLMKLKLASTQAHFHKCDVATAAILQAFVEASMSSFNKLPMACFIYVLLVTGASLVVISCFGYVRAYPRSPCCVSLYSMLLVGLFVAQLGASASLFYYNNKSDNWLQNTLQDINSSFCSTNHFFTINQKFLGWVAFAALTLEVIALVLALYLQSMNRVLQDTSDYESADHPLLQTIQREEKSSWLCTMQLLTGTQVLPYV